MLSVDYSCSKLKPDLTNCLFSSTNLLVQENYGDTINRVQAGGDSVEQINWLLQQICCEHKPNKTK